MHSIDLKSEGKGEVFLRKMSLDEATEYFHSLLSSKKITKKEFDRLMLAFENKTMWIAISADEGIPIDMEHWVGKLILKLKGDIKEITVQDAILSGSDNPTLRNLPPDAPLYMIVDRKGEPIMATNDLGLARKTLLSEPGIEIRNVH